MIWHHLWQDKPTHTSTQFNLTSQDRMSLPFSFCLSEEDSSSGVTSHAVSPSVSPPHVSFPLTHRKLRACHVAKEHGSFLSEILFLLSFPLILCGLSLYFQHLWTNSKIQLDTIRNPILRWFSGPIAFVQVAVFFILVVKLCWEASCEVHVCSWRRCLVELKEIVHLKRKKSCHYFLILLFQICMLLWRFSQLYSRQRLFWNLIRVRIQVKKMVCWLAMLAQLW